MSAPSNIVRFAGASFCASRPEVLPLLRQIEDHTEFWGVFVEFLGTEAELVAAGVAFAEMFATVRKSGKRSARTENGDKFTVERRAGGRWLLELRLLNEEDGWWEKHGAQAGTATAEILARFARPQLRLVVDNDAKAAQ